MAKKAMDKLITRKEAASILGISVKTLDAARTDGLISYVQYVENGCVYFTEVGMNRLPFCWIAFVSFHRMFS